MYFKECVCNAIGLSWKVIGVIDNFEELDRLSLPVFTTQYFPNFSVVLNIMIVNTFLAVREGLTTCRFGWLISHFGNLAFVCRP